MSDISVTFLVDGETGAKANKFTDSLQQSLANISEDGIVSRIKEDQTTLDFGTTLAVVIGSQFAVQLAKALQAWLTKHPTAQVTVKKDGTVIARNIYPKDVPEVVRMLKSHDQRDAL